MGRNCSVLWLMGRTLREMMSVPLLLSERLLSGPHIDTTRTFRRFTAAMFVLAALLASSGCRVPPPPVSQVTEINIRLESDLYVLVNNGLVLPGSSAKLDIMVAGITSEGKHIQRRIPRLEGYNVRVRDGNRFIRPMSCNICESGGRGATIRRLTRVTAQYNPKPSPCKSSIRRPTPACRSAGISAASGRKSSCGRPIPTANGRCSGM